VYTEINHETTKQTSVEKRPPAAVILWEGHNVPWNGKRIVCFSVGG